MNWVIWSKLIRNKLTNKKEKLGKYKIQVQSLNNELKRRQHLIEDLKEELDQKNNENEELLLALNQVYKQVKKNQDIVDEIADVNQKNLELQKVIQRNMDNGATEKLGTSISNFNGSINGGASGRRVFGYMGKSQSKL